MDNLLMNIIDKIKNQKQIIPFAGVGFVGTVLDMLVLKLSLVAGIEVHVATAIGFLVGLTNNYILNRRYVFQQSHSTVRYGKYFVVSAVGLLLTEIIIDVLYDQTRWLTAMEAKLVAVFIVFFWNYVMSKKWAFK